MADSLIHRTLHQRHTKFNADSIEFVPASFAAAGDAAALRTFVCGNYQLNEATREKVGRIYLYQLQEAAAAAASSASTAASDSAIVVASSEYPLLEHAVLETDAIFDLKWCPRVLHDRRILGQADASGRLILYDYQPSTDASSPGTLTPFATEQVVEGASCLSLDWSNRVHEQAEPMLALSQSNSAISTWRLTSSGLQSVASWTAHEYEMWIVAFNAHTPHILYSGADDCKFRGWDLRAANTGVRSALFTDTTHEMGVCSIASHPTREHILATGSYDEQVRIWDTRALHAPLVTHSLGGGAWRVRWRPPTKASPACDTLLCCAMHNGFAVVDIDFGETSATAVAAAGSPDATARTRLEYKAHASLAYGADWCAAPLRSDADLVATCSFYDKQMNVWTIEKDAATMPSAKDAVAAAAAPAAATSSATTASPAPASASTSASAAASASSTSSSRTDALRRLLSPYFHQDYELEYPTDSAAFEVMLRVSSEGEIRAAVVAINALLETNPTDEQLLPILVDQVGCWYDPTAGDQNLTYTQWLARLRAVLIDYLRGPAACTDSLASLLAGFFYENWDEEFSSYDEALEAALSRASLALLQACIEEIDALRAAHYTDVELERIFCQQIGCHYYPDALDQQQSTHSQWIVRLRNALAERLAAQS